MTEENKAPAEKKPVDELAVFRGLKRAIDKLPFEGKERALQWLAGQVEAERQARWKEVQDKATAGQHALTGRVYPQ